VSTSKTLYIFSYWLSGALWRLMILFYWAFLDTVAKSLMDDDYRSLANDGALLLRVPLCRTFLVLLHFARPHKKKHCSIAAVDLLTGYAPFMAARVAE